MGMMQCLYPWCPDVHDASDTLALHLMDDHFWSHEEAADWLRNAVEAEEKG